MPRSSERKFELTGLAVLPVVGDPIPAMSADRQTRLLSSRDAQLILEASSILFGMIERGDGALVLSLLPSSLQLALRRWASKRRLESTPASPTPLHPMAVLMACNLALLSSHESDGEHDDVARIDAVRALAEVSLQFNESVTSSAAKNDPYWLIASVSMVSVLAAIQDEAWGIFSAAVIEEMARGPKAQTLLHEFGENAGLTLDEWHLRTRAERATRELNGAMPYSSTDEVDPSLEEAWLTLVGAGPAQIKDAAMAQAGTSSGFHLGWLGTTPVVRARSGRFSMWLGALNYQLLPSTLATTLAAATGRELAATAAATGEAAATVITREIERTAPLGDLRIPEAAFPSKRPKCDYLIESDERLVGLEFTVARISTGAASGCASAVPSAIKTIARKAAQVFKTLTWRDPRHEKRWFPVVVFASPQAIHPIVYDQVQGELSHLGIPASESSELMLCHATEFLDLVAWGAVHGLSISTAVGQWRDDHRSQGASLDWWLSRRNALRAFSKLEIARSDQDVRKILTRTP